MGGKKRCKEPQWRRLRCHLSGSGHHGRILKGRAVLACGGPRRSSSNTLKCHMLVFGLWEQEWPADSQCHTPAHILKEDLEEGDPAVQLDTTEVQESK